MSTDAFPIVRVTLYGSGSSGKTSLIDAFVNNGADQQSEPTEWPALYYRVCRLRAEEESADAALRPVCVEIEDTYDATRLDDGRDIRKYMTMKRKLTEVQKGSRDFTPFRVWKPPRVPTSAGGHSLNPVTNGRMGMMIVFDVNQKATLTRSMEIYDTIESVLEYRQEHLKPVIFLVGNKYDVDPTSEKVQRTIGEAQIYAQSKFLRFWKVSAMDGKNVKKMFEEMLYRVLGSPSLWELDYQENMFVDTSEEDKAMTPIFSMFDQVQDGCVIVDKLDTSPYIQIPGQQRTLPQIKRLLLAWGPLPLTYTNHWDLHVSTPGSTEKY